MYEFLAFKKMITPLIIQILFWLGVAVAVICGIMEIIIGANSELGGGGLILMGILSILLGPIFVRVYCELVMVLFNVLDELTKVRRALAPNSDAPVVPISPPPAH